MLPKVILLDFDGVIIESVGIKDRAFEELYQDYPSDLPQIMEYHLAHNATIRFTKFRHIAEKILNKPYGPIKENELGKKFSNLVFSKLVECPYVEGASAFLEYYYRRVPLYLISISPEEELSRVLQSRGLKKYFKQIFANPTNKSDAFKTILKREQLDRLETIYIGDTPEDFQAASTIGIPFIGRNSKKDFPEGNFPVFENMRQIQYFLNNLK
jgi:phosphoglycolate phosphatase-like HAD superfamily hydrolase